MKQTIPILTVAALLCGMLAGCATHDEHKQAAFERWGKSAAQSKLQTVEGNIQSGRLDEARKTLAEPESAQAHFLMGRVHFIEQRNASARLSFAEAISLDASHDAAWFHLGVLSFLEDNPRRALEAYQTALALKPAETGYIAALSQLYLHLGYTDQARHLLEDRLGRQPRNYDLLIAAAELYQRTGQLDRTAACYEQALVVRPNDAEVLEALGYCYIAQSDWRRALETFERLLKQVPEGDRKTGVLDTLALCAFNSQQYGQALRYYDRLLVLRRDDAAVWLHTAQAALGANRFEQAADNARRALQLHPSWPQAYAVLGSALYLRGDYDGAIAAFTRVLHNDEVGGYAWFMTGRSYERLNQSARAETAYQQAGSRGGDSLLLSRFLGTEDRR